MSAPPTEPGEGPRPARFGPGIPAQVGEWETVAVLGQGGMGVVLRARHRELGAERALKLMRGDTTERARLRFEREGSILARVDHPGVVRIHEARWEGGTSYFVMDLIEGRPLNEVTAHGRLPFERALAIAIALCEGVGALHQAGVIHRDLKPQNVILREDDQPVVIDLGLAVAPEQDQRLTRTGTVLGTFNTMAPEQIDGRPAGKPSDVWALGLIAFELLTGESATPRGGSVPELARQILGQPRPLPCAVDPGLPAALDEVLGAAFARDPERRPPDALALAELLRDVQAAPGPSRRTLRRLRVAVAAALLLVLGVLSAVGWRALRGAPDRAQPAGTALAPPTEAPSAPRDEAGPELARLSALSDPDQQLTRVEAWLARWGDRPQAGEARALRRKLLRERPWRVLEHEGLLGATWGPPGQLLSWSERDVRLWDVAAGQRLRTWTAGAIRGVAVEPAAREWFLIVSSGGALHVGRPGQDALEPLAPLPLADPDEPLLRYPQLNPGGGQLLLQTGKAEATIFALAAGQDPVVAHRLPQPAPLMVLHYSRDHRRVLSGCGSPIHDLHGLSEVAQAALVWDAASGRLERQLALFAQVNGLDLAPDGVTLAVASPGNEVNLFDLRRPDPTDTPAPLIGKGRRLVTLGAQDTRDCAHDVTSRQLRFTPDGRRLVTSAGDRMDDMPKPKGELGVWDVATRRPLLGPLDRPALTTGLELDPQARYVALGLWELRVEVWDLSAAEPE